MGQWVMRGFVGSLAVEYYVDKCVGYECFSGLSAQSSRSDLLRYMYPHVISPKERNWGAARMVENMVGSWNTRKYEYVSERESEAFFQALIAKPETCI